MSTGQTLKVEPLVHRFEKICAEQIALCQSLEDVADNLGSAPQRIRCLAMAKQIDPVMDRAHNFEVSELFPALDAIARQNGPERIALADRLIKQLKSEHDDDVCLVGEVVATLLEFGQGPSNVSPDAMGYLLRGLFVSLRRHLAFEGEAVRAIVGANQ